MPWDPSVGLHAELRGLWRRLWSWCRRDGAQGGLYCPWRCPSCGATGTTAYDLARRCKCRAGEMELWTYSDGAEQRASPPLPQLAEECGEVVQVVGKFGERKHWNVPDLDVDKVEERMLKKPALFQKWHKGDK